MKRKTEKALYGLIVATGIASVVSQLLILREYLTQFHGNEYVIALIFFTWLLLGAGGNALAGTLIPGKTKAGIRSLTNVAMLAAIMAPATLMAVRLLRDLFLTPGASAGFYRTLGYIVFTLGPYGLLVGFLLPQSLAVLRTFEPAYPATRVYLFDNIGDCAGGALFAFVLIVLASPFQAVAIASGLLVMAAVNLLRLHDGLSIKTVAPAVLAGGALVAGLVWEIPSLQPAQGHLALYRESKYGRITVVQDRGQATIFSDGVPLTSSLDVAAAEAAVHYPMAQIDRPGAILLISAGAGMLRELEKYQPESVDYVELNPAIAAAQLQFNLLKKIHGLQIIHRDGRAFLAETHKRYDAIIINISDPETFQANRYYTAGFYRLARARLNAKGVLSFSIDGYANYLSESRQRFISSLHQTVKPHFKNVLILPGDRIFFICSDGPLDRDIPGRLAKRGIRTSYVDGYFYGNITDDRIDGLVRQLLPTIPANQDTTPYLMRLMFTGWFDKYATSPAWLYLTLGIGLLFYFFKITREKYLLFSTGFMSMGSEIAVIFAFQIFFGYIYSQISLVVTIFLAGLLPGALLGQKLGRNPVAALRLTDGMLIGLLALFILIVRMPGAQPGAWVLLGIGFGISILCGCQFPLALKAGGDAYHQAAAAFTADLVGAACGALLSSVLLIPYLGLTGTLAALIVLKMTSLMATGFRLDAGRQK